MRESFPCSGSIPSTLPKQSGQVERPVEPGAAEPRYRPSGKGQLMSLPSPAWPQRDEPPACSTATGLPPPSSDSDSGCALEEYLEPSTDPTPPEVPLCFGSRSSPPLSPTDRTQLRVRALLQQLPPQDCDERYCPGLTEEERRQLRAFSARRRQEALGQGLACPVPGPCHGCPCKKCGRRLNKGDPGILASRLGGQFWHPACFSCHFCHQPLVDLIYFQQDGRIYCGRHHAELFRPRCASCDQLIFMEECIEAEGRRWHLEHFCCLECEMPLRGQRYVMRSGRPCCRACFDSLFAEPCQACGDLIGADSEEATHQGLHWHARASCFCCSLCRKPLRGQPLSSRRGRLFCSETCSLGWDVSSSTTSSDSSDSAFASAPSPDSTPLSRAGPSSRTTAGTGSASAAAGCRQRREGDEAFLDQAPLHPAFRGLGDHGAAAKERSRDAVHSGVLGPPPSHPSTSQPNAEDLNEPGALGQSVSGGPDPRAPTGNGNSHFQGVASPPRHSPQPEDINPQDITEEDDSWCPTCSSSSDSDEEGFFFGKPIPKPGMNSLGREPLGKAGGRTVKPRGSSKHCSVS